jgi:fatty acid desaturase
LLGLGLVLSGLFAQFLAATGRFLPHDERFLGMTAHQLCALHGCRVVHFMIHDRMAFGGALVAVGALYLWLAGGPLRRGERWAWRALAVSGGVGFASFLAYLGFGYFDVWHAAATLVLLPCYVVGLVRSRIRPYAKDQTSRPDAAATSLRSTYAAGRACLFIAAAGLAVAGLVILIVGTTCVFVPQDLQYMGVNAAELRALNPRLVPLIAHDRAGFGGAACCFGVLVYYGVRYGAPSRALWSVLTFAGLWAFAAAIGVHFAVGYTDGTHLAPAVAGAALYLTGLLLTCRRMVFSKQRPASVKGVIPMSGGPSAVLPSLRELGADLLRVTTRQKASAIALPFLCCGAYFASAAVGWWAPAVAALVGLSFFTYPSTSHDLVHANLGLPRRVNDGLLCVLELLALRSGHAYRAAHLHHHARYPHPDDIESTAARKSWLGALAEGPAFPFRIWLWAIRHAPRDKAWIAGEGIACVILTCAAAALAPITPVFLIYTVLMIAGGWTIPFATSFVPHRASGGDVISGTRAFRGVVASCIALEHLYHLEHHLYPSVPHQNWPRLAKRLDPYLAQAGVKPVRLLF